MTNTTTDARYLALDSSVRKAVRDTFIPDSDQVDHMAGRLMAYGMSLKAAMDIIWQFGTHGEELRTMAAEILKDEPRPVRSFPMGTNDTRVARRLTDYWANLDALGIDGDEYSRMLKAARQAD